MKPRRTDVLAFSLASVVSSPISGAKIGDAVHWLWFKPDGTLCLAESLNSTAAGKVGFWDEMFIAGYVPSTIPGNWSVRVSYNGALLLSESLPSVRRRVRSTCRERGPEIFRARTDQAQ